MSVCLRVLSRERTRYARARLNKELNVRKTREIIDHFSPHIQFTNSFDAF